LVLVIDLTGDALASDTSRPLTGVPVELRRWAQQNKVTQVSTVRGAVALLPIVVGLALGITVGNLIGGTIGLFTGWAMITITHVRTHNMLHEAVHRHVFRSPHANDVIALLCGALLLHPAASYRGAHLVHHAHTRQDGDTEAFYDEVPGRAMYLITIFFGGLFFCVQMCWAWIRALLGRPHVWCTTTTARHIRIWSTLAVGTVAAAVTGAVMSGHGREVLVWWLVPGLAYMSGPYVAQTFFEHRNVAANTSIVDSSGTIETNRAYQWLLLNGNYHLAHHVLPSATWNYLPAIDAELERWKDTNGHHSPVKVRHDGMVRFHRDVWRTLGSKVLDVQQRS
jgi:fatty acid desaturase